MMINSMDLCFFRGDGVISRLIRYFSRRKGQPQPWANHVATVSRPGILNDRVRYAPWVVEALAGSDVVERPLKRYKGEMCIARAQNISAETRRLMVVDLRKQVGKNYSEMALLYFLFRADKWLAPLIGYKWRICSVVPSVIFSNYGYRFGVDHEASISPEELLRFVEDECKNPLGKWVWVVPPQD